MFPAMSNKKGIMLFMVLAVLVIVVTITNGILGFVLSHYKQTYHRVYRIQAYYAALAGVNLAMQKLRTETTWIPAAWYTGAINCTSPAPSGVNFSIPDCDIPFPVYITISPANTGIRTINATVDYSTVQ